MQKELGPDASVAELKPYLKDIKGLKVNDPVVTIAFRYADRDGAVPPGGHSPTVAPADRVAPA